MTAPLRPQPDPRKAARYDALRRQYPNAPREQLVAQIEREFTVNAPAATPSDVSRVRPASLPQMAPQSTVGTDLGGPRIPLPNAPGPVGTFVGHALNAAIPFADEIAGRIDPVALLANTPAVSPIRTGAEYETMRRLAEFRLGQGAAEHPVAATGGTIAGAGAIGLALPGATPQRLAVHGGLRTMATEGAIGAATGAVYGAGASDPGQRLEGAVTGAVTGGPLAAGTSALGSLASRAVGSRAGRAALDVAEAGDVDIAAVQRGLATADPETPLMAADVLGPIGPSRVRAVTTAPNPMQREVAGAFAERAGGRPSRLQGILEDALGATGINPREAVEQLRTARAQEAETLFEAALAPEGKEVALPRGKTVSLLRIPRVRDLVEEHRNLQRQTGTRIPENAPVTARELHYVKRVLRESGERVTPGERAAAQGQGARDRSVLGTVERALEDVPGYATANRKYREASQIIEAYELGTRALEMDPATLDFELGRMTDEQVRMVQLGLPASTARAIESGSARAALSKLGIGPSGRLGRRSNLSRLLPKDVRERFAQVVANEEGMLAAEQAATGGLFAPSEGPRQSTVEAIRSGGSVTGLVRREIARSLTAAPTPEQLATEGRMLVTEGPQLRRLVGEALSARGQRGDVRRTASVMGRLLATITPTVQRTGEVAERAQRQKLYDRLVRSGLSPEEAEAQVARAFE